MTDGFFPATSMPDPDWWRALWPDPEAVVRTLGVAPWMTVLDLCCGDGYFTAPLARIVGGSLHALDIDPAMIERTRRALKRWNTTALGLHCADARALPEIVPGATFDFVLLANTFHGVPDKPGLARAVARVLKADGRFAIVNWHPLPRERTTVLGEPRGPATEKRMSPEDVQAAVAPAGFAMATVVELPPYHYGAIFAPAAPADAVGANGVPAEDR